MKKSLYLLMMLLPFYSCSDNNDEPEVPKQIVSEAEIREALARSIEDSDAEEYVDQTILMKQALGGEWVIVENGQPVQKLTFDGDMKMHTFPFNAEGVVQLFPSSGNAVAYGHTVFIYASNGYEHLESDLYAVCEILSVDDDLATLRIHGGTKGPEMHKELLLVKSEDVLDDISVSYPKEILPNNNLFGSWEISSITRVWDGKDVLAPFRDMQATFGIERPLPSLSFQKDGAVIASYDSYFFHSNNDVNFWGQTFVLYREDFGEHCDNSIVGVYEIESLSSNELMMIWHPGSGDSPRRMVLKKV